MNLPKVSVIIPAYNQAQFLGDAIQSVLDQTYANFELIVVNDASPDHTAEVVRRFTDPRIKSIVHKENRGLPATRNTGMRASSGELIALLDADDYYHNEKLERHVKFHELHTGVGVTYNARFELNHSSNTLRDMWCPPQTVDLCDLIRGWPFAPSDIVIQHNWAKKIGYFNETLVFGGEDLDFQIRLALSGCQFIRVSGVLNYRRHHSGRPKINLDSRLSEYLSIVNNIKNHPKLPRKALSCINEACVNFYLEVAWYALSKGETSLGQECISLAENINPTLLEGKPSQLMEFLLNNSIKDDSINHEICLRNILTQLPSRMNFLYDQLNWAVARGYFVKGVRAVLWGRQSEGQTYLKYAHKLGARIDATLILKISSDLINYEAEFGFDSMQTVLDKLLSDLALFMSKSDRRRLLGIIYFNQTLRSFQTRQYENVPKLAMMTIIKNPSYIVNRGMLSMLLRTKKFR
jgi:glycosyltransferase involved in cell wall biosynthesis